MFVVFLLDLQVNQCKSLSMYLHSSNICSRSICCVCLSTHFYSLNRDTRERVGQYCVIIEAEVKSLLSDSVYNILVLLKTQFGVFMLIHFG